MISEEKQLLLKDLCARLPYGVICHANEINLDGELIFINKVYNIVALYNDNAIGKFDTCPIADIKPYLRSMSNMTEEEENEYRAINCYEGLFPRNEDALDYVLSHHFDFRDLIPMGLALEVTKDIYINERY